MGTRLKGKGEKKTMLYTEPYTISFSKMNPGLLISDFPVNPISKQVITFRNSLNSYRHIYTLG